MRLRYWIAPLAALVLIAAGWFVVRSGFDFRRAPVELTILALNDFHGYLQPPPGGIRAALLPRMAPWFRHQPVLASALPISSITWV